MLGGSGTLTLTDDLNNDGVLTAGAGSDVALLSIVGDVTQSEAATLAIELDADTSDAIAVGGAFEAGGVLSLAFIGELLPEATTELVIVTATEGVSGQFTNAIADSSTGTAIGVRTGSLVFDVVYLDDSIVISNIVPAPGASLLLGAIVVAVPRRRRRLTRREA